MPDFQDTKFPKRRENDCEMCDKMTRAFLLNDLGEPDFDGHRKAHAKLVEAEKIMDGYKSEATKKVIGFILSAVIGAMSLSLMEWLGGHVK